MNATIATDAAHVPAAITALMADYVHCIDEDRLEDWPELFTDPCLYRITTRDNERRGLPASIILCDSRGMLRDRVVSVRHANVFERHTYRHLIGAIRLLGVEDGLYRTQSNYLVSRTMPDGTLGLFSSGEYRDLFEVEDGRALFRERVVICDHSKITNLIAIPL